MHLIRTTMQPEREIEVTDSELLDLTRQGLVLNNDDETVSGTVQNEEDS